MNKNNYFLEATVQFLCKFNFTHVTGTEFVFSIELTFDVFERRSTMVPTSKIGMSGQCCRISGTHLSETFWKLLGHTTEKHRRKISVLGYETGRNLMKRKFDCQLH